MNFLGTLFRRVTGIYKVDGPTESFDCSRKTSLESKAVTM